MKVREKLAIRYVSRLASTRNELFNKSIADVFRLAFEAGFNEAKLMTLDKIINDRKSENPLRLDLFKYFMHMGEEELND